MIVYKIGVTDMDWIQLFNLYEKAGLLGRFVKNDEFSKIQLAFEASYKVVTAWDGEILVGAGRMLSDGICYGAIFDVGVLPEYQKKGIGKGLMQELLNGNEHMPIHLTSTLGNEDFYKKLGFKKHKTAFSKYPFATNYVEDQLLFGTFLFRDPDMFHAAFINCSGYIYKRRAHIKEIELVNDAY